MNNVSERRKHARLPTAYVTRYRLRGSGSDYDVSQTQNVSQGGALLFTNRMLKEGDQLEMHIQFPFFSKKVMVIGEVVACKEAVKGSTYESRLKFIEMDEGLRRQLGEVIERRRKMGRR